MERGIHIHNFQSPWLATAAPVAQDWPGMNAQGQSQLRSLVRVSPLCTEPETCWSPSRARWVSVGLSPGKDWLGRGTGTRSIAVQGDSVEDLQCREMPAPAST